MDTIITSAYQAFGFVWGAALGFFSAALIWGILTGIKNSQKPNRHKL